eukprot:CAMPEP_0178923732 /NCGR_PEP_ID=MMETSP0786-20121207/16915_1 /TAXON_ID=186022 /ORGANISM="Thalassionema frauenfeldii, Strain CCMP 1798" /LENGTH=181 /DNA_ID=CAMNT_0020598325 /DNA_START=227 /DNA_END=772 /DNA_ORIENTATION=+
MWAKENYFCDLAAGSFQELLTIQAYNGSSLPIFGSPWTVWVNETLVLHDLHDSLDATVQEATAIAYWQKHKYAAHSLTNVSCDAIHSAYKSLPFSPRTWTTKLASDWAPTNKNMKRWRLGPTDKCPFCGRPKDALHMQTCHHPTPSAYRRSKLKDLPSQLLKLHTSPPAVTALLDGLRNMD